MGNLYQQVSLRWDSSRVLVCAAAIAPLLLFLAVYLPAAGGGFVRDDYVWVLQSQVRGLGDLTRILTTDLGFYRPAVGLTFALNEAIFGFESLGYGLTNVLLALGCAWAIGWLARSLGVPRGGAILAASLWLLNAAFLPIGVLWISGRTALVMIFAATVSAAAVTRGRLWLALVSLAVALLSKEEAVVLPIILLAWLLLSRAPAIRPLTWGLAAGAVEAAYFGARSMAGATSPLSALPDYRFTLDPVAVAGNLGWYLTLIAGVPALVTIGVWLFSRASFARLRQSDHFSLILPATIWLAGSLALTMWLPVRSRLYLGLPAVGACLAAAALCSAMWSWSSRASQRAMLVAGLAGVAALTPIHLRGAREWTARNNFAATVLHDLGTLTAGLPRDSRVVLADDRNDVHGNLASVFGTMANDAGRMAAGRAIEVWIEPAPPHADAVGLRAFCPECPAVRLSLIDGRLRRAPSP